MRRSSIVLLGLVVAAILVVVFIWVQFIPDSVKAAFSPYSDDEKERLEFVKNNLEEVSFFTKTWPAIVKMASRGKIDESFCADGGGEKFWDESYRITCISLVRKQYESCYYMKNSSGGSSHLSLDIRQCIEYVMKFTSQKHDRNICEKLRDFKSNPEDYINCRAWVDKNPQTCLYLAQYKDDINLRYTQAALCMVNLAKYTHSMRTCDDGREFYNKYKAYLDDKKVGIAVNHCYKFK